MQASVVTTGDSGRQLTIEIPRAEIDSRIDARLNALGDQVSIEGFRPGKAPPDAVRNKFGAQIRSEVQAEAIQESLTAALSEQQLEPVADPIVTVDESSPDDIFRFSVNFDVMPTVDIQPVSLIKLTRPVVEVTDADIDNLQENLRRQRMQWSVAEQAANEGDRVTVSYNGTIDGNGFPGSAATDLPVVIGEGSLPGEFERQLIGQSAGSAATISITMPDTFPDAAYRGKTANYDVTITRVESPLLPEMDERFFRSFGIQEGGYETFRAQLRKNMEIELKHKVIGTIKNDMLEQLLALHPIQPPESLVTSETARMKNAGESSGDPAMQESDYASIARHRITCGIILTQLARELGISATPEQVREEVESIAQTYENPEEVVAWYYSSQEQLASVESMVTEELIVSYVLEHGQIDDKPVSFQEMMGD